MTARAADWYPDTKVPGGERYWDGDGWTEQRRNRRGVVPGGTPAAGWYPDPTMTNTRRYWDGERWTRWEHQRLSSQVYRLADRPQIELLVDDTWYPGELRMWTQARDGSWSANVMWSRVSGENRIDTFPADHVRPLTHA